jgi:hypothetical protein
MTDQRTKLNRILDNLSLVAMELPRGTTFFKRT